MPRKVTKTDKPPLLFVERPLGGARLQNVPDVRAAINPKEFFTETQNRSALNSWVSPQFDASVAAAPPVRRGRRKCQSATSILDGCSPLSRKTSVCRYPSLSFHTGSRDHQPKTTRKKKATECGALSNVGDQPQGSRQNKRTVPSARHSDAPKRQFTSIRKKKTETFSEGAGSHSRCLDQPETPSIQVTERCRIPAEGASTPVSSEFVTTELRSASPPPDVDTPKVIQGGSSCPLSPTTHLLLAEPCTPPCDRPPDILVPDTPERDYGVKVTWRRRKSLMLFLKERGHLSESDALIHS
ncbi:RAD9, HUS1, RAD1-interacting nuclear orphan protein 1 [Stegastes partitus]|uniref:RAD9, HUS1, RAD1-interacting nuclear orphan protein 1 n=1 Tax=Stegastes partitus TaxID=144197 RepID=A0A3B4ZTC1_9TELE|nr:PREDICTED: RAD9, HUS1, RAD1-interacting nuclear orphan protein 1 [Stegastes partitus]XP_008274711.1 PREDICTED: RAD9, HUS1, RAD1-interacting nuclear orphan protein 1 [Stegastes partitus]